MVFSGPKTAPKTVVKRLKNAPQPIPLIMANSTRMPREEAKGQMANALTAQKSRDMIRLFNGPRNVSAVYPAKTLATVEAIFQIVSAIIAVY